MPATESDSCSVVRHNLQPDSISRNSHDVAVGGVTSRACRRDQSMPSTNAASCADVSRIIPSAIGGHRNAPCSRRFQNSTRPEPSHATIFTRRSDGALLPAEAARDRHCPNTTGFQFKGSYDIRMISAIPTNTRQ